MSLIVKIILLGLAFVLSLSAGDKTQYFIDLCFNSSLQLINGISSEFQKLLENFNGTAIVVFFGFPVAPLAFAFPNNLALYLKNLKSSVFAILLLLLLTLVV